MLCRSIFHRRILNSILNPINSSASSTNPRITLSQFPPSFCYFSNSPVLQRKQVDQNDDGFERDPDAPPRLFVVQPRIRPETSLKAKLEEALNLANSLEQQRDGNYATEFLDKEMPPHLVVQNPLMKTPRAGYYSDPCFPFSSCLSVILRGRCICIF